MIRVMTWSGFAALAGALPSSRTAEGVPNQHSTDLYPRHDRTIVDPINGQVLIVGENAAARTIYTLVTSFCSVALAFLLGYRARQLKYNTSRRARVMSIMILVLYFLAIMFNIAASVVQTGLGLSTYDVCYSAAMICLVFYTSNKLVIYIFLLERARVVRAPFVSRRKDWVWLVGIVGIVGGFGSIAIYGFLSPVVELSDRDGRCRIGLPPKISFPLLSFDVGVNLFLTGTFFLLLRPILSANGDSSSSFLASIREVLRQRNGPNDADRTERGAQLNVINKNIKTLLWKSLIGSALIMLPTVGNMVQFYVMKGRELGWICLTICTLDVSWGAVVIHWLTMGSQRAEDDLTKSVETLRERESATSVDHLATVEEIPCERRDSHTLPTTFLRPIPTAFRSAGDIRKETGGVVQVAQHT